jgi:membrane-associated phospholipid phosphatase
MTPRVPPRSVAAVALAGCAVGVAKARKRLGLPPALTTACWFAPAPLLVAGFRRSPRRDAAVWIAHMLGYKQAFELPNDDPDRLRRRARVDYPIAVDRVIGRGMPPGRRLQRRLRTRGHLSRLDKALTFFYWTWEVEPHAVLAWIRWRHPDRYPAAALRLATLFDLTLVGYWSVPTAPPWWASEEAGRMDGDMRRVVVEVADWVKRKPRPTEGNHELGANPFAAMPSDHFASAMMTAAVLADIDPRLGAAGVAYALMLGFALVYLGEHYVSDLLAGLALAAVVSGSASLLDPNERGNRGIPLRR